MINDKILVIGAADIGKIDLPKGKIILIDDGTEAIKLAIEKLKQIPDIKDIKSEVEKLEIPVVEVVQRSGKENRRLKRKVNKNKKRKYGWK